MPMGIIYEKQISSYISVWRCGFSSAKLAHEKSKPVMLLGEVILAGNVCHRLYRHDFLNLFQCKSFIALFMIFTFGENKFS